jgi:hypothetical protein
MGSLQSIQRRLEAIFSWHRRKAIAKWCIKRYSNAKTLGKVSIHIIGMGYKYVAYKTATGESTRMVLAALLLVLLFSLVISVLVKRRRSKQSQTKRKQQQNEKIVGITSDVTTPITPFKPVPKVRMLLLLQFICTSLPNHFFLSIPPL